MESVLWLRGWIFLETTLGESHIHKQRPTPQSGLSNAALGDVWWMGQMQESAVAQPYQQSGFVDLTHATTIMAKLLVNTIVSYN